MANIALDDIIDWIDECSPSVVSSFRSIGPGNAAIVDAIPAVASYFRPSGDPEIPGYEPPPPEEGGEEEGGSRKPLYPYQST